MADKLVALPGHATAVSLELPETLTFAEWREAGREIGRIGSRLGWLTGDWWNFAEFRYGERRAIVEAEDWDGPAYQTCADCGWVAGKFETSRRREGVSFNHHRAVAGRPPVEADRLLDWCMHTGDAKRPRRSVIELRNEVHRLELVELQRSIEARHPLRPGTVALTVTNVAAPIRTVPVTVTTREAPLVVTYRPQPSPVSEPATSSPGTPSRPEPTTTSSISTVLSRIAFGEALAAVEIWYASLSPSEQTTVSAALVPRRLH